MANDLAASREDKHRRRELIIISIILVLLIIILLIVIVIIVIILVITIVIVTVISTLRDGLRVLGPSVVAGRRSQAGGTVNPQTNFIFSYFSVIFFVCLRPRLANNLLGKSDSQSAN